MKGIETSPGGEVTRLLEQLHDGETGALDELVPLLYGELRRIAREHLRRERPGHTLVTTALVNEAYLRLVENR
ncbi:MAG: ECF-type sigma factor, partial [Acidobacteriota bacterium]